MQISGFAELGLGSVPYRQERPGVLAQLRAFVDTLRPAPVAATVQFPPEPEADTDDVRRVAHPVRVHWGMNS